LLSEPQMASGQTKTCLSLAIWSRITSRQTSVRHALAFTSVTVFFSTTFLLILRALGLLDDPPNSSAFHTWLLDVGHHLTPLGAAGGIGAGVAGSAGSPVNKPDPCESERNAVNDAEQKLESAQNHVEAVQMNFGAATANLPQQLWDTWLAGQQSQAEWAQNPTLGGALGPLEQGLQNAVGGPSNMPLPSEFPPTNVLLNNLNDFFSSYNVSGAIAAAPLGAWSSRYTDQDPWGSGMVPFATQEFIRSMTQLEYATNSAVELQNQLNHAQTQLKKAQQQLHDAQQALSDCADSSAVS